MTFDPQRYRAHLAPLELSREQEDQLLFDLWKLAEGLVDKELVSPTYPLQFTNVCQAFAAVEEAIAVESNTTPNEKEEV